MLMYEFRCTGCGNEFSELVKMDTKVHSCPECGEKSQQVILNAPQIDWGAMGAQTNAGPEFIDRFERVHKEEAAREKKLEEE